MCASCTCSNLYTICLLLVSYDCCFLKFVNWDYAVCRVMHLHCVYIGSQWRLTALGCQNGYVVVAIVDVINKGNRFIGDID